MPEPQEAGEAVASPASKVCEVVVSKEKEEIGYPDHKDQHCPREVNG